MPPWLPAIPALARSSLVILAPWIVQVARRTTPLHIAVRGTSQPLLVAQEPIGLLGKYTGAEASARVERPTAILFWTTTITGGTLATFAVGRACSAAAPAVIKKAAVAAAVSQRWSPEARGGRG